MNLSLKQQERIVYEAMLLNMDIRVLKIIAPFLFVENTTASNKTVDTPITETKPEDTSEFTDIGLPDEGPQYYPEDDSYYPM